VVAFHLDEQGLTGGFLGVDAFFVLSGFLITTLLVLEWRRHQGIGLLAFWGRRARRLLPALLLVILAVAIFAWIEVPTDELGRLRGDGIAGLFYVANWRFVASGQSYFDLFTSPSPFRHLWSLAIEEQFYLIWPLVTLGCLRLARGRLRVLAGGGQRVERGDRAAGDEGALGSLGQAAEVAQPVEHDQLQRGGTRAAGPRAGEDVEPRGEEVGDGPDGVARAGDPREEARVVAVLDVGEDVLEDLGQHLLRIRPLLRRGSRQPLPQVLGRADPHGGRLPLLGPVVGHDVDDGMPQGAERLVVERERVGAVGHRAHDPGGRRPRRQQAAVPSTSGARPRPRLRRSAA
jgi:hypothetical protein